MKTAIAALTFHHTRHEAITRLAKHYSVLNLARIVGHRDIKQLMTYYNRTASDIAKEMPDKQAMGQPQTSGHSIQVDKDQLPTLAATLLTAMQSSNGDKIEVDIGNSTKKKGS
jgi:hypothetical protein